MLGNLKDYLAYAGCQGTVTEPIAAACTLLRTLIRFGFELFCGFCPQDAVKAILKELGKGRIPVICK